MTERERLRKLHFAQTFTRLQPRATRKLDRRYLLASFQFDGRQLQYAALPANHAQTAAGRQQRPRRGLRFFWSAAALPPLLRLNAPPLNRTPFLRHRLAPEVADLSAKVCIGAGPRRKAAHVVVNLLRRTRPVNAPVFPLQDRCKAGRSVVLRPPLKRARG